MFHKGSIVIRIIAALLLVAILAAGGFALYRLGFAQGVTQNQVITSPQAQNLAPLFHGSPRWMFHGFGFFPIFMLFGLFLFGIFILGLLRLIFRPFGWGAHGMHHRHGYPRPWDHEHRCQPEEPNPDQPGTSEKDK